MNHSMREDALRHLPGLICHEDEPVFHEAWEAGAFAMVLQLCEAGYFTWSEWTTALAREIKTGADRSEANPGEAYYLRWLAALEGLCAEKALVTRRRNGRPLGAAPISKRRMVSQSSLPLGPGDLGASAKGPATLEEALQRRQGLVRTVGR